MGSKAALSLSITKSLSLLNFQMAFHPERLPKLLTECNLPLFILNVLFICFNFKLAPELSMQGDLGLQILLPLSP